jgi:hypothetical protein
MRGRVGRQTRRRTKRELTHSLSRSGRKWVKEVWEAADGLREQPDLLTPLAGMLADSMTGRDATSPELESEEVRAAWSAVIKAGYASRAVLAEPTDQPSLDLASVPIRAHADGGPLAGEPGTVERLTDPLRGLALDDFTSVMSLPPAVWSSYVATAGMRLQRNLTSGPVTWRQLDRDRMDRLMRYGYVLRTLDEALGACPAVTGEP